VSIQKTSLHRFDASVFQSMLEQIEPYYPTGRAFLNMDGSALSMHRCYKLETNTLIRFNCFLEYQQMR